MNHRTSCLRRSYLGQVTDLVLAFINLVSCPIKIQPIVEMVRAVFSLSSFPVSSLQHRRHGALGKRKVGH